MQCELHAGSLVNLTVDCAAPLCHQFHFFPPCSVVWKVRNLSSSAAWLALHAVTTSRISSQCFYQPWPVVFGHCVASVNHDHLTNL